MTLRSVDLRGLTLAEAKLKVRELIDSTQEEGLADYEIAMTDIGADPDNLAADLAHQCTENVRLREEAIEKMAAWAARRWRSFTVMGGTRCYGPLCFARHFGPGPRM